MLRRCLAGCARLRHHGAAARWPVALYGVLGRRTRRGAALALGRCAGRASEGRGVQDGGGGRSRQAPARVCARGREPCVWWRLLHVAGSWRHGVAHGRRRGTSMRNKSLSETTALHLRRQTVVSCAPSPSDRMPYTFHRMNEGFGHCVDMAPPRRCAHRPWFIGWCAGGRRCTCAPWLPPALAAVAPSHLRLLDLLLLARNVQTENRNCAQATTKTPPGSKLSFPWEAIF